MNNVFFDKNIAIDIIQERERMIKIQNLLDKINQTDEFKLFVSAKSVADIYYILRKQVTKLNIDKFLAEITILDSTATACDFAISKTDKHDDIEDIMQIACCNKNKIDTFITADVKLIEDYGQLFNSKIKIVIL